MKRRVVAISVFLVALASLVFAGSNGLPALSVEQPQQKSVKPSVSGATPKRDYVEMKSDEGWQMEHNGQKIMVVVGNFAAHHNGTVITADSAVRYSERHLECFGNVLINRGTTYIYGDRAEYDGDINEARVYSKIVKVVDGDATLFTYNFVFNTKTNIGEYSGGGVLVNNDNMLESDRGYYYSDSHEIICVDRVQMRNKDYEMKGDSVVYNTDTNFVQFFTATNIWNKSESGRREDEDYLYTDRGTFDKNKQLYKLTLNGYILTKDQELLCDSLDYYRDSNYLLLRRNIQIDDRSQKMMVFGDWGEYWKEPGNVFVTKDPSIVSYDLSQGDSVFMRSDSMFIYTRYPIREKIEKARKDSLEQAAKAAMKEKTANNAEAKNEAAQNQKKRLQGMQGQRREKGAMGMQSEEMMQKGGHGHNITPSPTSQPTVDSLAPQVAKDSTAVAVKTKAELRREMIDSLANDTTKYGKRLRAKLIKEETAEANRAIKVALREHQRKMAAERKVVLAERRVLFAKLFGEARARDAVRKRNERIRAKFVKDSTKRAERRAKDSVKRAERLAKRMAKRKVATDSLRVDTLKLDSLKIDSLKLDSLKRDVLQPESLQRDTLKVDSLAKSVVAQDTLAKDSLKVDTLAKDSVKVDTLAKFATMTAKQVKEYFKAINDAERAEIKRIKKDSLDAKLDRIGLARQAKRVEQYKKWAHRDSVFKAKADERAYNALRRKIARQEKRGIFIQMADSAALAKADSTLLADYTPLDSIVNRQLDSIIDILFPKPLPSPTQMAKADSLNLDSLYREIKAYSRVKMFRSDFQSVCDSLTMTTIDSVINMYKLPVLWNENNQITSDVMHVITRNNKVVRADFEGKPLTVAEVDTVHYNQVAGKEMTAFFRDNQIYRNDVNGNVRTIYYMQEDDSPDVTLMAYIESGDMTSYIENKKVVGITYRGNPSYIFYPINKIPESQPTKLDGFKWEANRRPTQDSVFTRVIRPSQRIEKRALIKPLFPINAILQQRKSDYIRRREWQDRTDTLTYETIEWLESLKSY